jgi:DNA-binding LacI/PurR family transcriptional regulator
LLLRTGCRRLAYLGLGGDTFADAERSEGFAQAAAGAGCRGAHHKVAIEAFAAATQMLSAAMPPDGVFCSNDSIAIAAIEAARALHFRIPEDVSIIGFNDVAMAGWRSFQLTTIAYPVDQLVGAIIKLLESRLSDRARADAVGRVPVQLVPRATTRQVPAQ